MTRVSKIIIYPVKSLGGIEVPEAYADIRGFKFDRRWVITDHDNKFITQREIPGMSGFVPTISGDDIYLVFGSERSPSLEQSEQNKTGHVKVWNDEVEAKKSSSELNKWLSERLGKEVLLWQMTEQARRSEKRNGGLVSFADRWPYLILGIKSVDDLNTRLDTPTKPENFRPNIIIDNPIPYEEERWKNFRIGNLSFSGQGACGRCQMINIDQDSGKINDLVLKTLSSYRSVPGKIPMGLQASTEQSGMIRKGDIISVSNAVH